MVVMTQTVVAPEAQLDQLANEHSQLKAQMQLICARKQDSLAQAKFRHKKRTDQLLQQIGEVKQHRAFVTTRLTQLKSEWSADQHTLQQAQTELDALMQQQKEIQRQRDELIRQLKEGERTLSAVQQEKETKDRQRQDLQRRQEPALQLLEPMSGLKIEIVQADVMRFIYQYLNERSSTEECFITLNLSSSAYKLVDVHPYIPDIAKYIDGLNEKRDVFSFLKNIRKAFAGVFKAESSA